MEDTHAAPLDAADQAAVIEGLTTTKADVVREALAALGGGGVLALVADEVA